MVIRQHTLSILRIHSTLANRITFPALLSMMLLTYLLCLYTAGSSYIGSSSLSTTTIFVSSFSTTQTYYKHAQQKQQHLLSNQRIKTLYNSKLSSRIYSQRNPSQSEYKKLNNRRKSNNDDNTIQRNNHDRISYNQKNKSNRNEHKRRIIKQPSSSSSKSPKQDDFEQSSIPQQQKQEQSIRLNKVFKATHSRRQADTLISDGRVSINGQLVLNKGGYMVQPFVDIVTLDGIVVKGWEQMNGFVAGDGAGRARNDVSTNKKDAHNGRDNRSKNRNPTKKQSSSFSSSSNSNALQSCQHFDYVKYYKPKGIICTTDVSIQNNIIHSIIHDHGYKPKHRIFPVGRLDKETSGLILLTSDGRLPNVVLRGEKKQPKVYNVVVDKSVSSRHVQRLRDGIVITTVAQRDGKRAAPLTQRTKPCQVEKLGPRMLQITLVEGRNRQIRKMLGALEYTVVKLHRIEFMGITMDSSSSSLNRPGDWGVLNEYEMSLVEEALSDHSRMVGHEK